jgi:putative ABC transport system permease protein
MFRNYLVTAIRNFARHKLYSFINIVGLAVGLACAIFIILFIRDEISYDAGIPGTADLYRVEAALVFPGIPGMQSAVMPYPLGSAMQAGIPEVQSFTRDVPEDMTVRAGDRLFPETVEAVDPGFFAVIELPLAKGMRAHLLAEPESVVLSERTARKYFGDADPMGKTLMLGGKYPLAVTGVLRDPPHNSNFQSDLYISNKSKADSFGDRDQWLSTETYIYVRLLPGANPQNVVAKTQAILRRNADPSKFIQTKLTGDQVIQSRLVPLAALHLTGDESGNRAAGNWATIYGFAAIAGLILLIACFNFTNLATARAMMRARETALRKVVGANRRQLIVQFLGESVLTALIALILAVAMVEILLPTFDAFLDRPIAFHYLRDWPLSLALTGITVLAGVLAGFYPALVLSGFRPVVALKPAASGRSGAGVLRTSLVVLQFAISIGLGIAAIVVFAQLRHARHLDLGFDRDNMVVIEDADALTNTARESLMHRLAASPDIAGVTQSSAAPFGGLVQGTAVSVPGSAQQLTMRILTVAPDFFNVYGTRLLAGRFLTADRGTDVMGSIGDSDKAEAGKNVVIDAAAAHDLGFAPAQAVGHVVLAGSSHAAVRIVGVVADARFFRARDSIDPTIYVDRPTFIYTISVRVKGGHIPQALAFIDGTWRQFAPTIAIRRHFLDDSFDKLFATDEKQGRIFGIFVGIAIFVACLGLFGLAAFTAERRTREIGLRKAFGASTRDIVRLLLWQFSIPVLIANSIAWPVAYYYLHNWLEGYAYHIALSPIYFVTSGAIALLIAWTTIIAHAVRVARANPIDALRYE